MKKLAVFAVLGIAMSSVAHAAEVRLDFLDSTVLSGSNGIAGNGDGIVASLLLQDTGLGQVTATLTNLSLLTSSQFFGELKLNLSPFPNDPTATFLAPVSKITFDENGIQAPKGNRYDVSVEFLTNASARLGAGQTTTFVITGQGLDAADFLAQSSGGGPMALLHVQGVGPNANDSGWVSGSAPVPEPATMAVLAIGALGVARRRRLRKD